ncbi:hypothetical protein U0070_015526 [Myodes glareolus]|uniref:Uncharacterized protein n=1 Tax=Myodes glareolus TaxID=447135 RepID=A0AAW0IGH3_MYOGA
MLTLASTLGYDWARLEHLVFKGPLALEALRGHLERMGWMDHQACLAPRENQGTLGTVVHLECPDLGVKLGSRALQVILARRVRLVLQAPLAYLEVDHRADPENWALGDLLDLREPRAMMVHMGHLEQLEALVLQDLQDPLVSVVPQEVWVPLASEAPLGKTGRVGRREQQGRKAARGQLVHGVIPVLLAFLGHLEKGRTGSRVTEEHLGSLALPAAVATQALGLLVHPALQDDQETKDPRDLEVYRVSLAPRDQLARMVHQEIQEKEGLLENQYVTCRVWINADYIGQGASKK